MKISDIRKLLIEKKENNDIVNGTIELLGVSFLADEDTIFGKLNHDYIQKEIEWYESQSRNVNDMREPVPAIWKSIADVNGMINSNYGWCLFSEDNYWQYSNVLKHLSNDIYSRRAVAIYTRPRMHIEYDLNGMRDFICTNSVQYLVRDNKLHVVVNMRANDVVFGFRNDLAWQRHIHAKLLKDLNDRIDAAHYHHAHIQLGDIIWQVGSLHIYERHFQLIS
jgi:thymidylate synthase